MKHITNAAHALFSASLPECHGTPSITPPQPDAGYSVAWWLCMAVIGCAAVTSIVA